MGAEKAHGIQSQQRHDSRQEPTQLASSLAVPVQEGPLVDVELKVPISVKIYPCV